MKTVRNKTHRPLRVRLSSGRVLHLGPAKTGQIAAGDAERDSVQKMVAAGEIEIVGEGPHADVQHGDRGQGHSESHGFHPPVTSKKRGDR